MVRGKKKKQLKYQNEKFSTEAIKRAMELGETIVNKSFSEMVNVRSKIVEQILTKIVGRSDMSSRHFSDLLSTLVNENSVMENSVKFKDTLDYISQVSFGKEEERGMCLCF